MQRQEQGHQDDVETGDEAGVGGGGVAQAELLQGGAAEEQQPRQEHTRQRGAEAGGIPARAQGKRQ